MKRRTKTISVRFHRQPLLSTDGKRQNLQREKSLRKAPAHAEEINGIKGKTSR